MQLFSHLVAGFQSRLNGKKFKNLVYSINCNSLCHHICSKSSLLPILSESCLFIGTSKVLPYSWRYPPPSLAERIPGTIFHELGQCRHGTDQTPTKRIQKTKSNVAIGFILQPEILSLRLQRGRLGTEEAFAFLTQKPWVRIVANLIFRWVLQRLETKELLVNCGWYNWHWTYLKELLK